MNLSLEQRLKIEAVKRTHFGAFFQIAAVVLVGAIFSREKEHSLLWLVSLVWIFFLAAARIGYFIHLNRQFKAKAPQVLADQFAVFMGLLLLSALSWGSFCAMTIRSEGLYSLEGMVLVFVVNALLCGVLHALASSAVMHRLYTALIAGPTLFAILYNSSSHFENVCGLSLLLMVAYLLLAGHSISQGFIKSIELEIDLRGQKEKLQGIVDSVPGFVAVSDNDAKWIEHSDSFEELKSTDTLQNLQRKFLHSTASHLTEEIDVRKNDVEFSFMVSLARLSDQQGAIMVGIPTMELKNVRQQLEMQRSHAEFSSRLSTLGEMAAGIAHEINNPLAVISGNAGLLQRLLSIDPVDKPKIHEKLEKIITTSHRISKIVQGLRTFSRQGDKDPFMTTSLEQVVQDSLELCREKFKSHGVQLILDPIPQADFPVRSVQICQIMVNILSNAFDALKDQEKKTVHLQFEANVEFVKIKIEDNGPGIPADIQKKIFEPFFTTKEVGKGTGLGLSVTKGIMEDHQGDIHVFSKPGSTMFELKLPRQRKVATTKAAA